MEKNFKAGIYFQRWKKYFKDKFFFFFSKMEKFLKDELLYIKRKKNF